MKSGPASKTIVIGLDGATWDVLDPMLARGRLPNLAALTARGTRARCLSTTHPVSPVAWSSIATGKNAGKHGIFDFGRRAPGSYRIETVSSRLQRGPTLWDLASAAGLRCGVFNVPVTYPPRPVNGFMVTSIFTPSNRVCFTHPAELSPQINDLVGGYEFATREVFNPGHERAYVDSILRTVGKREKALDWLLDRYPIDCGMLVYIESDHVQHKLWPAEGFGPGDPPWPGAGVAEVYERLDAAVGRLLDRFGPGTNLLVVSDHGAGPMRGVMYINRWLLDRGYLRMRRSAAYPLKWLLARTDLLVRGYRVAQKLGLGWLGRLAPNSLRDRVATSFVSFDDIDWTGTRAYSHGEFGQIYLNLKGREPQGTVEPGAEAERTLADLARELSEVTDPATGRRVVTRILRREEVFHGPAAGDGPDLLFVIDDYARDASVQFGIGRRACLGEPEFMDRGCHRPEGVLIAAGPDIKAGRAADCSVMDVTPTALHLAGLPVPEDVDGRVLGELLAGDAARRAVGRSAAAEAPPEPEAQGPALSEAESREVEKRLRDLGYLD
jgi:predicted AlkP superfamily phosphohydrolase/phosphomutase